VISTLSDEKSLHSNNLPQRTLGTQRNPFVLSLRASRTPRCDFFSMFFPRSALPTSPLECRCSNIYSASIQRPYPASGWCCFLLFDPPVAFSGMSRCSCAPPAPSISLSYFTPWAHGIFLIEKNTIFTNLLIANPHCEKVNLTPGSISG
jgi:hypothetical protein